MGSFGTTMLRNRLLSRRPRLYTFGHLENVQQRARIKITVTRGKQTAIKEEPLVVFASEETACRKGESKLVACD